MVNPLSQAAEGKSDNLFRPGFFSSSVIRRDGIMNQQLLGDQDGRTMASVISFSAFSVSGSGR